MKVGYDGVSLGVQPDPMTVANEEHVTFSVLFFAEGATMITRVGLATRAFTGFHTEFDIDPWIEKASRIVNNKVKMNKYPNKTTTTIYHHNKNT